MQKNNRIVLFGILFIVFVIVVVAVTLNFDSIQTTVLNRGSKETTQKCIGFCPPSKYSTPFQDLFVTTADFNRDGILDLATATPFDTNNNSSNVNNVSVMLGKDDGTFGAAKTYNTNANGPYSINSSDFNRDGKLDIVVGDVGSGTAGVSILIGNGDGTFGTATKFAIPGSGVSSLAIGDFNRDGKMDVATGNAVSGTQGVSILFGDGNDAGTFGAPTIYTAASGILTMIAEDFNHDGKLDIVSGNDNTDIISILPGNENGTFGSAVNYPVGGELGSIVSGDFNRDGNLDVASNVSILLGNGNGIFGSATRYSASGTLGNTTSASDFNQDGKLDLATASTATGNKIAVYVGNGDGTFGTATNYNTGNKAFSFTTGDFNRDSKLDLATANGDSKSFSILLNALTK